MAMQNQVDELLQLLTVLGADIEPHQSLAQVSPSFLRSRLQQLLGLALPSSISNSKGKLSALGGNSVAEDLSEANLAGFFASSSSMAHQGHSHQHADGSMCSGEHGGQQSQQGHSHSHDGGHGHDHSHGGHEECHEDELDEASPNVDSNQVIQLLRNYLSMVVQQIQETWRQPPLFPGGPVRNAFFLKEHAPSGRVATPKQRGTHNLLLTVAGSAEIPASNGTEKISLIMVSYAHDSPEARKSVFGGLVEIDLPREILHMFQELLEYNAKKCPAIKSKDNVQQGPASAGFRPSFIAPLEDLDKDATSEKFDLKEQDLQKLVECIVCKRLGPEMKCARCKQKVYCSGYCQLQDWKEHKNTCGK